MRYYVGIDIGKREHVVCITDEKGKLLRKPITFRTTSGGFNKFLKNLDRVI